MTARRLPLAISAGDPAGVGPELAVRGAASCPDDSFVLYGDARQLEALAAGVVKLCRVASAKEARERVSVIDCGAVGRAVLEAHAPTEVGGRAQLRALDAAAEAVADGAARALVTGPTSKEAISLSGVPFSGQTEHLARLAGLGADEVTMLFLGPRLSTGLVTTHHALRDVPGRITEERVMRTARHLAQALLALGRQAPRIVVAGLNPHAGEGGLFGDEEARVIGPAVTAARSVEPFVDGRASLEGPIGAETAFRWAADGRVDGVVAMTHDQGTIAAKLLDWGASVNVTWGLPFVRTSVDHGVAYDAARSGEVSVNGIDAAIAAARALVP
ncbi:MAG: 4-hydroxythreonine-4-phosphate dehydrogenase [Deltaproteobacteria bacterium]|nr:MAG: 4-hydroxythreonine-4-phosphate dehydrogenase [Deltaproteobacteria bacterium]